MFSCYDLEVTDSTECYMSVDETMSFIVRSALRTPYLHILIRFHFAPKIYSCEEC